MISCGEDKTTIIWDADGPSFTASRAIDNDSVVTSASLFRMQNNRIVVSGCTDGTIRLHHEAGKLILQVDTGSKVVGVAVIDMGDLVVATERGLMRIESKDYVADFLWRNGFSNSPPT